MKKNSTGNGNKNIDQFWSWFSSVASDFGEKFENANLILELDKQISLLGGFSWELGPGIKQANALVISPNGDPNLLPETRAIAAKAPILKGWEFHPAIPPKQWKQIAFQMEDESNQLHNINGEEWRYVMLKYPDNAVEIMIEIPDQTGLKNMDQKYKAALIALDGLLGEAFRLEHIDEVSVETKLEAKFHSSAKPLKEIISAIKI